MRKAFPDLPQHNLVRQYQLAVRPLCVVRNCVLDDRLWRKEVVHPSGSMLETIDELYLIERS